MGLYDRIVTENQKRRKFGNRTNFTRICI